jgi:hypothetical protein
MAAKRTTNSVKRKGALFRNRGVIQRKRAQSLVVGAKVFPRLGISKSLTTYNGDMRDVFK